MNKIVLNITLCMAAVLMNAATCQAQQSNKEVDLKYFAAKMKKANQFAEDFSEYWQLHYGDVAEREIAKELYETARTFTDRLDSICSLVLIYSKMSCEKDRKFVQAHAEYQFSTYLQSIDILIKQVNLSISESKIPAITVSGIQLKDDLREIKDRLERLKFK